MNDLGALETCYDHLHAQQEVLVAPVAPEVLQAPGQVVQVAASTRAARSETMMNPSCSSPVLKAEKAPPTAVASAVMPT